MGNREKHPGLFLKKKRFIASKAYTLIKVKKCPSKKYRRGFLRIRRVKKILAQR